MRRASPIPARSRRLNGRAQGLGFLDPPAGGVDQPLGLLERVHGPLRPDDPELVEHDDERHAARGRPSRARDRDDLEREAAALADAGSDGSTCSQIGHVGDTNATSRRGPGPPTSTFAPSGSGRRAPRAPRPGRSFVIDLQRAERRQPQVQRRSGGRARPLRSRAPRGGSTGRRTPRPTIPTRDVSPAPRTPPPRRWTPPHIHRAGPRSTRAPPLVEELEDGRPVAREPHDGAQLAVAVQQRMIGAPSAASPRRARTLPSSSCSEIVGAPCCASEYTNPSSPSLFRSARVGEPSVPRRTSRAPCRCGRPSPCWPTRRRTGRTSRGPCPRRRRRQARRSRRTGRRTVPAASRPARRRT